VDLGRILDAFGGGSGGIFEVSEMHSGSSIKICCVVFPMQVIG